MPTYIKVETGPLRLEFLSHESVESFDAEAGFPGAALDYAQRWHIHRGTLPELCEAVAPMIEKLTGVARAVDQKATAREKARRMTTKIDVTVYESFSKYASRVFALTEKPMQDQVQALVLEQSRMMRPSAAIAQRVAPIEQMFYAQADSLLENDLDTINSKVSKFLSLVERFELARDRDGKPVRDSLARLCQRYAQVRFAQED